MTVTNVLIIVCFVYNYAKTLLLWKWFLWVVLQNH